MRIFILLLLLPSIVYSASLEGVGERPKDHTDGRCAPGGYPCRPSPTPPVPDSNGIVYGKPWTFLPAPGLADTYIVIDPLTDCHWIKEKGLPMIPRNGKGGQVGCREYKLEEE